MTWQSLISYLLAALAAMGNALANVMQRKAGLEQPADQPFGPKLLYALVRRPTWLLGFAGLVSSFVLQAVALGLGQLSAIEPVITLEVPLTLLVASRVFSTRLGRAEWGGILTMTAGMIALVAFLDPRPGNEGDVPDHLYLVAGGGTAATIALLIVAGRRGGVVFRTGCLGAAAGTSFGLTATLIKETIAEGDRHGIPGVLSTWQTYAAIGFGILGLVVVQWALHVGPLLAAQPGFTLMDPLVSILWGVLVFDEATRMGAWLLGAALGAVAVGVGVVILAHSPVLEAVSDETKAPPGATVEDVQPHLA